ncbi:MAG: hypothetical protein ABEK84_00525, partial [Salinibacter sp.]
ARVGLLFLDGFSGTQRGPGRGSGNIFRGAFPSILFVCHMLARNPVLWGLVLVALVGELVACTAEGKRTGAKEEEEAELASHMSTLQRWTHKATLALQARNGKLADFYLHEMKETVETVREEVPTYEGHPVADLTKQILDPSLKALDSAVDQRAWKMIDKRVDGLARACNRCHAQTDHGFIRVDLEDVPNPYAQDFAPAE